MKKLHAVVAGEYSDIHTVCLAQSKKLAQRLIKQFERKIKKQRNRISDYRIWEFWLVEDIKDLKPVNTYFVQIDLKGRIKEKGIRKVHPWQIQEINPDISFGKITSVSMVDHDHALKSARDYLAKYKAEKSLIAS